MQPATRAQRARLRNHARSQYRRAAAFKPWLKQSKADGDYWNHSKSLGVVEPQRHFQQALLLDTVQGVSLLTLMGIIGPIMLAAALI